MSLESFKVARANAKRNIQRIKAAVNAGPKGKALTVPELKCRLGILESYFTQILDAQTNIEALDPNDEARCDIEDLYISTKISIEAKLGEHPTNLKPVESLMPCTVSHIKIPALELPTFNGKYSQYKNFITSFMQVIDREPRLSNVEKFNHLRNCLKGPALETINAFQITSDNYPKALERLTERYDNTTLIFLENITTLFQLKCVSPSNAAQLRSLVDNASALYCSLLSLGDEKSICNAMLIHIVMDKVDAESQSKWKESLDFKKLPTWAECAQVLERRCQFLESIDGSPTTPVAKANERNNNRKHKENRHTFSLSSSRNTCNLCAQPGHTVCKCPRFNSMDVAERFETAKRLALCINCLSKNHKVSTCSSIYKCRICSQGHHTLLHRPHSGTLSTSPSSSSPQQYATSSSPSTPLTYTNTASVHTHCGNSSAGQVILATALILVQNASGEYQLGRALLDSCSQVNLVTEDFAQRLRLPRERYSTEILSIGNSRTKIKHTTSTSIKSRFNGFEMPLSFCITSNISYQPECEIDISNWNVPMNIQLADEYFYKSKRIDVLLGTESFFNILSIGQLRLGDSLPCLQKTLLGWVVSGRYKPSTNSMCIIPSSLLLSEEKIDKQLENLWKLDDLESKPTKLTPDHLKCEEFYIQTVKQTTTGRVMVRLPLKDTTSALGNSFSIALRRFNLLERRLSKDAEIKLQYVEFMREYLRLGHMSLVESPNFHKPHCFIPHHCVQKPTSTTTTLRVVFDASCKTSSQRSLNDILLVGPTIQDELYMLLIRFRLYRFAITADIVKMYRQVLIDPCDRRLQYILWRNSEEEQIRTYELNTVTYGTAAAPFLAIRTLHFLAEQYALEFPLGSQKIKDSFYVDDFLCGADSSHELSKIKEEVSEILSRGCMQLTKWHSNHTMFRGDNSGKLINLNEDSLTSTLGITWNQVKDVFLFSFNPKLINHGNCTKRTILSIASSLFDPLGLLAPLIIIAKIILQELWILKLSWDESVPQHLQTAWEELLKDLSHLPSIEIPRYCLTHMARSVQIHGFCDASIRAYGCCLYLRTVDSYNNVSVRLLTAKSRVAPTKKKSLPKLELCGAVLLAQLYQKNNLSLSSQATETYLWTDSQIVLHWIKQHSATLSTFVGNRICEIQDATANCRWRHVPTSQNPADIVSRGSTVREIQDSIWFTGPKFLLQDQSYWPINKCDQFDSDEANKEKRKSAFKNTIKTNYIIESLSNYSSHMKTVRIAAWMLRFYRRLKKIDTYNSYTLSSTELENAMLCIVWNLQQLYFFDDIQRIQKGLNVQGSLKYLNPFLQLTEGFNLLKVGGRLELANVADEQKHPILLPSQGHFVEGYIHHLHIKNYHAGARALIALVRQRFWIINIRTLARRVVNSCIHCIRYKPRLLQQIMGNLPAERLNPSRPFSHCAVDFCGPINTYYRIRGKGPYKTYIAVFVCLASKAVHIEVVSDLSTDAFIASLKRLIGRRGLPTTIFCDNATNFVGARNQLAALKEFMFNKETQKHVVDFCSNQFINFQFIPPRAPHFGGLWEAAVKSAKGHLYRTLKNTRLTFEELMTAMVEIEAVLNSRPLSPLSADPNELQAITPGHFLIGDSLKALPEPVMQFKEIDNLVYWTRITAIKQRFWQQWSKDYILELQSRNKWTTSQPNIMKGALVIIHEDNIPPQVWKMGRVIETISGRDQRVRVVDVQTAKGIIRRPVHKLALLLS